MAEGREHLTVGTDTDTYTEDKRTQSHKTHVAVGYFRWKKMEEATDETENEEPNDDEATFHAFSPFVPLFVDHRQSHKANNALPKEAASAIATARRPSGSGCG